MQSVETSESQRVGAGVLSLYFSLRCPKFSHLNECVFCFWVVLHLPFIHSQVSSVCSYRHCSIKKTNKKNVFFPPTNSSGFGESIPTPRQRFIIVSYTHVNHVAPMSQETSSSGCRATLTSPPLAPSPFIVSLCLSPHTSPSCSPIGSGDSPRPLSLWVDTPPRWCLGPWAPPGRCQGDRGPGSRGPSGWSRTLSCGGPRSRWPCPTRP